MKKRRFTVIVFVLMLSLVLSACGKTTDSTTGATAARRHAAAAATAEPPSTVPDHKILVACFSATGNTKPLAEYAADILGADLYEIVPEESYTQEDLNYNDSTTRATREQNDDSARPAISGTVENMQEYDTVIIAHPIWWGKEPKIIDTFIESYDFSGKTMTTLCTSASSGIQTSASNLQSALPDANWLESRRFAAGADRQAVNQWLVDIGLAD